MARVVLDSSVLTSAFLTPRGTAAEVLAAGEQGAFALCLSPYILTETAAALLRESKLRARYDFDQAKVEEFCDRLAAVAQMITSLPKLRAVTGDRKYLLPLSSYESVRIITPREFLKTQATEM